MSSLPYKNFFTEHTKPKVYNKGEVILSQGSLKNGLIILIEGQINLYLEDESHSLLLHSYKNQHKTLIPLMNIYSQYSSKFILKASKKTSLLWISSETFLTKYNNTIIKKNILIAYHNNYKYLTSTLEYYAIKDLKTKVYFYLQKISLNKTNVSISIVQIAEDLNISPISVSRIMKKLSLEKKIIRKNKTIFFPNI